MRILLQLQSGEEVHTLLTRPLRPVFQILTPAAGGDLRSPPVFVHEAPEA